MKKVVQPRSLKFKPAVASAVVRSKAVVLLFGRFIAIDAPIIWEGFVFCPSYVKQCLAFLLVLHLSEEEWAGCFTLIVFLITRDSSSRFRGLLCSV